MNPWEDSLSSFLFSFGVRSVEPGKVCCSNSEHFMQSLNTWSEQNSTFCTEKRINSRLQLASAIGPAVALFSEDKTEVFERISACLNVVSSLESVVADLLLAPKTAHIYIEAAHHRSLRITLEECAQLLSSFHQFWSSENSVTDTGFSIHQMNIQLSKIT